MEALKKQKACTVKDLYRLPDEVRAELIDGTIYNMAPPSRLHQKISLYLCREISDYIAERNRDCEVYAAPFAVFLNGDDRTCVEPDISVICDQDKLTDEGCVGAPDWTLEIVSPSSRKIDYYKKLLLYRTAGVKEYWVVDPERNAVTVYDFVHDEMTEYGFADKIAVLTCGGLELDLSSFR